MVCLGFCDWGLKYLLESLIKYGHVGQFYYVFFVIFVQFNHHTFSGQQRLNEIMDFPNFPT
jgi:hypothetical protein